MLIFLDIDGVMVPAKGYKSPEFLQDRFAAFSSKASLALNQLIAAYDATIMLTTSHKSNYNLEEWEQLFKTRGICAEKINALPANDDHLSRKDEIVNWFIMNNVEEDFVIIDDDKSLNDLPGYLKQHLVLTSSFVGLTEEHLGQVESIVEKKVERSH